MATVIDSQSVKAASTVTSESRGYDAGKKTSDAEELSSGKGQMCRSLGWESHGLAEGDVVGQAVV